MLKTSLEARDSETSYNMLESVILAATDKFIATMFLLKCRSALQTVFLVSILWMSPIDAFQTRTLRSADLIQGTGKKCWKHLWQDSCKIINTEKEKSPKIWKDFVLQYCNHPLGEWCPMWGVVPLGERLVEWGEDILGTLYSKIQLTLQHFSKISEIDCSISEFVKSW
jgi:hypothetical protein